MHGEASAADVFALTYSRLPITHHILGLACSCKAAAAAWRAHAARLTKDWSGGLERVPVPVDPPPHTSRHAPLPLNTTYIRDSVYGATAASLLAQAAAASFILECGPACACAGHGTAPHSTCTTAASADAAATCPDAHADADVGNAGSRAAASVPGRSRCAARLTQHGLAARVRLSWVPGKGWAAFAAEPLPAGAFVCRYEGELLRSGEAERRLRHVYDRRSSSSNGGGSSSSSMSAASGHGDGRKEQRQEEEEVEEQAAAACGGGGGGGNVRQRQRTGKGDDRAGEDGEGGGGYRAERAGEGEGDGHALLIVREVLPSGLALRLNIDATRLGNVARFLNHSCDGGCLLPVVVRRRGSLVPGVGLFARRSIGVGEELTFPYGPPNAGPGGAAPLEERPGQATPARAGAGAGSAGVEEPGGRAPRMEQRRQPLGAGQEVPGVGRARGVRRCLCGTSACLGFMPADPV
ncbi:hypothetical protein HXX76_015884 [Chlamydomonas incerta]|uniref:SET domain-containing protein n=1 Tax=Chlamydomonas incerta TaxID=51695 RepID=A0A835S8D4_CHLIN|nr:hypothetical protein HXX76_015884 [Chlamydomonas incerta]|eukprot:KAG2422647.1 hypothetical protein HXX76_015884 [Chlamydomonas incerta]